MGGCAITLNGFLQCSANFHLFFSALSSLTYSIDLFPSMCLFIYLFIFLKSVILTKAAFFILIKMNLKSKITVLYLHIFFKFDLIL